MTVVAEQQDMDLIPPAVRRRIEEMSKFTTPDPNAPVEGQEPVAGEPVAPEPAPATPPPEPKKEEPPAPPAEPKSFSDVANEEMTKEQRYKIMEGMQRAIGRDLSRAQREAQALRDEVEALKSQISARPAAPVSAPAPAAAANLEGMDELREAFGEKNLLDMVKFLRAQGFAVTQDLQQVQQQVGTVAQTMATSAHDRFEAQMDEYTDGRWKQINVDPKFVDYLNEAEGRTGISRLEFAKRHLETQNAEMLAQYFQDFLTESGEAAPATPKAPSLDKKRLAAPKATPAAGAPLSETDKPTVKMSEFTKLGDDFRAGKYTSDDPVKQAELTAKFNAEQARLNEAQRSGRLIPG